MLLNIALFVPFGATLAAGHAGARRMLLIVAASLALSTAIEAVQLCGRGRDPSLSDIVANTLGGLLGAAHYDGRRAPRQRMGAGVGSNVGRKRDPTVW